MEIRLTLEAQTAYWAALRHTEKQAVELFKFLSSQRTYLEKGDLHFSN
jgi:DNA-binding FadR family transcriptional regulator